MNLGPLQSSILVTGSVYTTVAIAIERAASFLPNINKVILARDDWYSPRINNRMSGTILWGLLSNHFINPHRNNLDCPLSNYKLHPWHCSFLKWYLYFSWNPLILQPVRACKCDVIIALLFFQTEKGETSRLKVEIFIQISGLNSFTIDATNFFFHNKKMCLWCEKIHIFLINDALVFRLV